MKEQNTSQANSRSASHEIPRLLWYLNVYYNVRQILSMYFILRQLNSAHIQVKCFIFTL